jgi:ABC-type polysaccharide/polyol phosphate transport system ATPase subunit
VSVAIRLEKVSKFYRPRGVTARRAWRRRPASSARYDEATGFAALRDVDLTVESGEAVAVIGRNGAGKTTLMRILAGVATPSTGTVEVAGRASSLLGLRAGMNPRLSGRDNVRLYGGLMGYEQRAVEELMGEIVAFSGLGGFVDQPVASYSPGMASRLAFATAVNLEPEILLVDEVLAVGDATFQKRALERMHRYFEGGSTVVLSSHNSVAVENLCSRAVWLDEGLVRQIGPTSEVIAAYQAFCAGRGSDRRRPLPKSLKILLCGADGERRRHFPRGEAVQLSWRYDDLSSLPGPQLEVRLLDLVSKNVVQSEQLTELPERGELRCRLDTTALRARQYVVDILAHSGNDVAPELLDRAPLTVFDPDEATHEGESPFAAIEIAEWLGDETPD